MTHTQLKQIQQNIKFDAPSMALCLGIPYHTYRNYIYGANAIPESVERAALELEQINIQFSATMQERVAARIDREFPHGFASEIIDLED